MKIQIVSDLHSEFFEDYPEEHLDIELERITENSVGVDALILAGDTGAPFLNKVLDKGYSGWEGKRDPERFQKLYKRAISHFCNHYNTIILVPGNHEFYGTNIREGLVWLGELENSFFHQLHVLENTSFMYSSGVCFIGATLWFGSNKTNKNSWAGMSDARFNGTTLSEIEERGQKSAENIAGTISNVAHFTPETNIVVVSHMAPSMRSVPKRFKHSRLNKFYVNELVLPAIEKQQKDLPFLKVPDIWIHGHTHDSFNYELQGMRVVCNPFGYYGHHEGWNRSFDYNKVIKI